MTTMETLRDKLPTTEELLHGLGLQYERTSGSYLAALGLFTLGALTGAVVALLLAPAAGRDLRHDVRERVRDWGQRTADELGTRGGEERRPAAP